MCNQGVSMMEFFAVFCMAYFDRVSRTYANPTKEIIANPSGFYLGEYYVRSFLRMCSKKGKGLRDVRP